MIRKLLAWIAALSTAALASGTGFVHPGLLHTRGDLDRMRRAVAQKQQPIFAGYEIFRAHPQSQADYKMMGPAEEVGRNPTIHQREFDSDANAAYQNAILWVITGEVVHAAKAKEILNAWASTLKRITGADAVLMAGLGPFKMVNAAEIIRYTDAGWDEDNARRFEQFCRDVIYPVLKDFAPFANGNWDTGAIKTTMAMGVYTNDRAMFERALQYYVDGAGDGRLSNYIYSNGQCQESGRDQAHTQLGLAHLGDASEIAWNQGLDLYSYAGNRLLAGFEYTAKYNLGLDVPFEPDLDRTGKYAHAAISPRGMFRPVFEQIYNHYVNRAGLEALYTQRAAEKIRPEGAAQGADHPGFGTLLFSAESSEVEKPARSVPPGGLVARSMDAAIRLTWISSRGGTTYTVKRATTPGGPYQPIATDVHGTEYTDRKVKNGVVYHYVVSDSPEVSLCAGLPEGWSASEVKASFDGSMFTLEAGGGDVPHRAWVERNTSEASITARFVPQVSSQTSKMGVVVNAGSQEVALVLEHAVSADRERPAWCVAMIAIEAGHGDRRIATPSVLDAPFVTWGRLLVPYWLRLVKSGRTVTGYTSADGATWTTIGAVEMAFPGKVRMGLTANSGMANLTTTVRFDHVTVR